MPPKAKVASRPDTGLRRLPPKMNKMVAATEKISIKSQVVTMNRDTKADTNPTPARIEPYIMRCSMYLSAIPMSSLRADIGEIRRVRSAGTRAETSVTPVPTKNAMRIVRQRTTIVSSGMLSSNRFISHLSKYASPTPAPMPRPEDTSPTTLASPMTVVVI